MDLAYRGLRYLFKVYSLGHQCCGSQLWIALTRHMQGLPWTADGPGHASCARSTQTLSMQLFHITYLYFKLQPISVHTTHDCLFTYFVLYFSHVPAISLIALNLRYIIILFFIVPIMLFYSSYFLLLLLSLINKVNSIH